MLADSLLRSSSTKSNASARSKAREYPAWGEWITGSVILLLVVLALISLSGNTNLQWEIVGKYLFSDVILKGVLGTLYLTILSFAITVVVGFIVGFLLHGNRVARAIAQVYIWFFRGTPLLVQLLLWFNIALVIPEIKIGIPLTEFGFAADTNMLISGTTAALLGLGLHEAAYMAENVRSGVISVPVGQTEAALGIGLRRRQALVRIVFPQMIRVIIPPTGNLAISLLKASSLVAAIGGGELLGSAQLIYGRNLAVVPLLIVATIWYLVLVSLASVGQHYLETKLDPARPKRSAIRRKPGAPATEPVQPSDKGDFNDL